MSLHTSHHEPARRPASRGFTFVELIATITILSVISVVAARILFTTLDGYVVASNQSQMHTELSVGLDRIVREMRSVGLDAGASGVAPDIRSIDDADIVWDVSDELEFTGGQVLLTLAGASQVLLDDVTSFAITAFDEANTALVNPLSDANCDAVRRIEFDITLSRNGVSESLRARLYLRTTMTGAPANP